MDIEVRSIKALLTDTKTESISGVEFVTGRCGNKEVVVAKCGVGKVFAAICAEAMIMKYHPELIVNVGVAGCLCDNLKIGDIVIACNAVQYDMDTTQLGDPIGMLSDINITYIPADEHISEVLQRSVESVGIDYEKGTIATGDRFVSDDAVKRIITDTFGAKACEMEGGAIAHVCYVNKVPFGILRAMSDGADNGANMDFTSFTQMAAANSTKVIEKFLSLI